jgi:hypothetical protein
MSSNGFRRRTAAAGTSVRSAAEVRAPADWWLKDIVPKILVADLYRKGAPWLDGALSRTWERPGRFCVSLSMWPEESHVQCTSYVTVAGAVRREEKFNVKVAATQLKYGKRLWLECCTCHRRSHALLLVGSLSLVCLECAGFKYASQSRARHARRLQRALAIRRSIGGEPRLGAPFPAKPSHVQWKTYDRLRQEVADCEQEYLDELSRRREKTHGRGAAGTDHSLPDPNLSSIERQLRAALAERLDDAPAA